MPWLETEAVEQRVRFVRDTQLGVYSVSELCERYGISRKTGYKWLSRFAEGGRLALQDRSRAPRHCPHRIPAATAELICAARRAHPTWGPAPHARALPEPRRSLGSAS
jgi:transposase